MPAHHRSDTLRPKPLVRAIKNRNLCNRLILIPADHTPFACRARIHCEFRKPGKAGWRGQRRLGSPHQLRARLSSMGAYAKTTVQERRTHSRILSTPNLEAEC